MSAEQAKPDDSSKSDKADDMIPETDLDKVSGGVISGYIKLSNVMKSDNDTASGIVANLKDS